MVKHGFFFFLVLPQLGADLLRPVRLLGGFTVRPFVRSIQRQSSSSRSSVASPLAFSDGGIKPSWSLAAKLNMRSNSPSRFSLDSRCSPPLERIGESCDDKVSTSCFGSYSRHERYFGSRSPLSTMESNGSEDNKRCLDVMYCRAPAPAPAPVEKRSGKHEATENNNQITAIDQNAVAAHGTPPREQKRKSSIGGFASKAESTSSSKNRAEQEKTPKRRLCATLKASESSSTPVKGKKVSNNKDKKSASTPAGTPSKKKETPPPAEATPQHRPCMRSTSQSSVSPSPAAKKSSGEKSAVSGRRKLEERSFSRDSMHTSPTVEGLRGSPAARSPLAKSGERRLLRSSSSSSSVTSLRSPGAASREQQRGSKPEEKGMSFFRSALRQRESRRSADLGKSSALVKKASERTGKQNGQAKDAGGDRPKSGDAPSTPASAETQEGETKPSSKPPGPLSRTLLGKSKSSTSEVSLRSPANGKKPLERTASSRKLSSNAPSPARTAPRPQ